jgi:hypothetical protein
MIPGETSYLVGASMYGLQSRSRQLRCLFGCLIALMEHSLIHVSRTCYGLRPNEDQDVLIPISGRH